MAVTLAGLILDVEDMLYGLAQVERPAEDTVVKAVAAANDVAWRMGTPSLWKRGDLAEYWPSAGTVGEVVVMAEDHAQSTDVTVRRAQLRTTAAASYSSGNVFRKNPAYPRVKIERFIYELVDTQLWPHVWYRSQRSITSYDPQSTYYALTAADFDVEEVYQIDLAGESVGDCTFAEATDTWTCTAHGLAVGDHVRFTEEGTAPTEYAEDTDYWVLTVPSADTFTLGSAADAAAAVDGTVDSAGTWTLEKRLPSIHPFPKAWWEVVTDFPGTSTERALRIRTVHDQDQTIFYTARSKPLSSAVTSLTDALADMIPWGVCWMLLGGTRSAARRHDPRARREGENESQVYADASFFKQMFLQLRHDYRTQIVTEKQKRARGRPSPFLWSGRW